MVHLETSRVTKADPKARSEPGGSFISCLIQSRKLRLCIPGMFAAALPPGQRWQAGSTNPARILQRFLLHLVLLSGCRNASTFDLSGLASGGEEPRESDDGAEPKLLRRIHP